MAVNNGKINKVSVANSMRKHFIDYAMSVIKERALPNLCDGFKPVQRRILYSMDELGLKHDKSYRKCARIVGDTLGKYHPHGDSSVYGALVRMSQDFSMRYPLIVGHGNFGSIDGDSEAAMRYTEAKMSLYGETMLNDIKKNTVDFSPNFDGMEMEPTILPSLIPNLLLNGSSGVAVGMATYIPPHNINNVYDALNYIIDTTINRDEVDIDRIIDLLEAPDFPTGGTIINVESARQAYKKGYGKFTLRGKYEVNDDGDIIITEIPYKINKSDLVEKICQLARQPRSKKDKTPIIPDIKEVIDESDKDGIKIVIKLKQHANPQLIISNLLKHTKLQTNISINMNVITANGEPQVLSIDRLLYDFLSHAAEVIARRSQTEYEKAITRVNIVDGILKCLEDGLVEKVIDKIRYSDNTVQALMELDFNEEQAKYISEMKIKALSKSSQQKLSEEKLGLQATIDNLNRILGSEIELLKQMKEEFEELRAKFSDERRTDITNDCSFINEEDLIKDEEVVITITDSNLIKSVSEEEYNAQKRGGKGAKAASTKEDEVIKYMLTTNNKHNIMFFTNLGKVHVLKAYKIPVSSRSARGKSIYNFISLDIEKGEHIVNVIAADLNDTSKSLLMATRKGVIKRLQLNKLSTRMTVTKIIEFREDDSLTAVLLVAEGDHVVLNTAEGLSLRTIIDENSIRPMGRTATGVIGMKFKTETDYVIGMNLCNKSYLFTLTSSGIGKKTDIYEYQVQGRGGKGLIAHKLTDKTGNLVAAKTVTDDDDIFIITEKGLMIRVNASAVPVTGRKTTGVKLLTLNENDAIADVSISSSIDLGEE